MASSATSSNAISFLSSSLFLSYSHQIPKTYVFVAKFGSGRVSKPLSVASQLATLPIISFDGKKIGEPKTKDFIDAMQRWGLDPKEKAMFLMIDVDENVERSSRNIGTLRMLTPRTLNLFDILNSDKLVLTPEAVEFLNDRYGVDAVETEEEDEEV